MMDKTLLLAAFLVLLICTTVAGDWEYFECVAESSVYGSGWASNNPSTCKASAANNGRAKCIVVKGYQWVGGGTSNSITVYYECDIDVTAECSGSISYSVPFMSQRLATSEAKALGGSGGFVSSANCEGQCTYTPYPPVGEGSSSASAYKTPWLDWGYYNVAGGTWETAHYSACSQTRTDHNTHGTKVADAGDTMVCIYFTAKAEAFSYENHEKASANSIAQSEVDNSIWYEDN